MDPDRIDLVKDSFEQVRPIADDAATLFYTRLFEIAPDVRPMFTGDMDRQGRMLMSTIGTAVAGLDRPEQIVPVVQDLGRRHAGYGVEPAHYPIVGEALLWTLEQGLGEAWNEELKEAWTEAYTLLATTMQEAAADA